MNMDFIELLKEELNQYRGLTDPYIMNLPDFVSLLSNLLDVEFIDSTDRRNICTALGYFIAPSDVIPESIYGPEGYVDDLYLCVYVLDKLLSKYGYGKIGEYWSGEEEFTGTLQYTLEKSGKELDRKNLRIVVLEYIGMS